MIHNGNHNYNQLNEIDRETERIIENIIKNEMKMKIEHQYDNSSENELKIENKIENQQMLIENEIQRKQCIRLETIYLANVVLYLSSLSSIINFKMINKKCQEATVMIRLYTKRFQSDGNRLQHQINQDEKDIEKEKDINELSIQNDNVNETIPTPIIPLNLFDIFPTIETICCSSKDITIHKEIIDKVKQIQLEITSVPKHFTNQMKKKIVSLKVELCSKFLTKYQLDQFPNLRYVTFYIHNNNWKRMEKKTGNISGFNERLEKIMGKKSIRLRSLLVYSKYFDDMTSLLKYENIERITLIINHLLESEKDQKYYQLEKKCFLYENYIEKFDCSEYITDNQESVDLVSIHETMNQINSISQLKLKFPLLIDYFDLRKCKSIRQLHIGENQHVLLEGLPQIEEIINCSHFDTLPISIHRLKFTEKYGYNQSNIFFCSEYPHIHEIYMEMETNIRLEKFLPLETIQLETLDLTYHLKERFGFENLVKELKRLNDCTTIKNKIIHFYCYHMQPNESLIKKLRKQMTITIDVFVEVNELDSIPFQQSFLFSNQNYQLNQMNQFINVKQLPTTIKSLKMYGHFRSKYFENINCLSHITKVDWEIQKKNDILCLSELTHLKELVIRGYLPSSSKIINLKESKTLQSLECYGCCFQLQLPSTLESLTIHNQVEILNMDDLLNNSLKSIDLLVSKNINFARFEDLQDVQLRSNNLNKVEITLPWKIKSLIYSGKFIIISNLNTILIERFIYQWDYSFEDILFSHWNYENDHEISKIKSLHMRISQNFDFRKFTELQWIKIVGKEVFNYHYQLKRFIS